VKSGRYYTYTYLTVINIVIAIDQETSYQSEKKIIRKKKKQKTKKKVKAHSRPINVVFFFFFRDWSERYLQRCRQCHRYPARNPLGRSRSQQGHGSGIYGQRGHG
jgi:hypothetical protein